jgi:cytochrome c-type biogenesis protein CcmF
MSFSWIVVMMSPDMLLLYLAFTSILLFLVLSLGFGGRLRIGVYLLLIHMASLTLSVIAMLYYLITRSFHVAYVASYTDRNLPLMYVVSALWAGSEGSLLFWSWIQSVFIVLMLKRRDSIALIGSVATSFINLFLTALLATVLNPFVRLSFTPQDGLGLNPLLQNPYMAIHPPMVFLGYASLSIPYGLAMAGLVAGDDGWITRSYVWILLGWIFLTLGIASGAAWSYIVLGWGGYWAWDPVENSSLIPWIFSTMLLHSIKVRGGRTQNILLAIFTFTSIVLASFITRSGIVESVHAFASMNVGIAILWFMIAMLTASLILLLKYGKTSNTTRHPLSIRDFMVLASITVFTVIAVTILWGTLYPLIIYFTYGLRIGVSREFFENIFKPLFTSIVLLVGLCVSTGWMQSVKRMRIFISTLCGLASLIPTYIAGYSESAVLAGAFTLGFTASSLIINAGKPTIRRLGFLLIHIGIALILLGYLASSSCEQIEVINLKIGEASTSHSYTYILKNIDKTVTDSKAEYKALITVTAPNNASKLLEPSIQYHHKFNTILSTIDVWSMGWIDIYVSLHSITENSAKIVVRYIPLVSLIWIGCVAMICGSIIIITKSKQIR